MAAVFEGGGVVVSRMPSLLESAYDSRFASNRDAALDRKKAGQVAVIDRSELAAVRSLATSFQPSQEGQPVLRDRRGYDLPRVQISLFRDQEQGRTSRAIQPFFVLDQDLLAGVGPE